MANPSEPGDPDLVALIGSRICHDLISPIGAINNGIELLGMTTGASGPELDLIRDSVENASLRVRFFRIAFGAPGSEIISPTEIKTLLDGLHAATKLSVDWHISEGTTRSETRLLFLAEMCLETFMPYGGTINAEQHDETWQVSTDATKLKMDDDLWEILQGLEAPTSLRPAHIHFALLTKHATAGGRALRAVCDDAGIRISF